jgi:outer membrane protein TolC
MARYSGLLALIVSLAPWWTAPTHAQSPWTREAAIAAARDRNPALAAARADVDRTAATLAETRGGWFPRLTLSESVQRGDQPVFAFGALLAARQFTAADFAVTRLNQPGATSLFTTRASIGQLVFDGGRTSGAIAQASAARDAALASADDAALMTMAAVTEVFGQLLTLDAHDRALTGAIDAAVADYERARHRRDAGTVTEADVLAAGVHAADLRQRLIQLRADRASAAAQFNRLTGSPIDAPVDVVASPMATTVLPALDVLFAEAEAARPDLRRAEAAMRQAQAGRRQAASVRLPQVAAQAGVEWNGVEFGDRARSWIVGGEVRWSVSISGADRARITAATSARVAAERALEDVRAAARVDVLSAAKHYDAALARVPVARDAVAQAAERARVVRNRYEAGLATMTDVLAAATASLDAAARSTDADVAVVTADAALQRALGRQIWK